ncbi:BTAD domain-containing putative transcriptional regulator [Streptomyces sp. NPDC001889]
MPAEGRWTVVEFGVLGPIEARADGGLVDLGHPRQRCVLAALLVDANRVVPVDELIGRVWADSGPQRARETLYSYLSRLRRALSAAHAEARIVRRSDGYVLEADAATIDLHRFRELIARARTADDERASALTRRALGLWRGEPFAAVDTPWFGELRRTLERERFAVESDSLDLDLRRGLHGGALPRLTARAAEYPLDERLAGQLMLALCRSGRTADALARYQDIRHRLAEELGIDPGAPLRRLHQQILVADPALDTAAALGTGPAPAVAPAPAPARVSRPVPRQLPPPPAAFVGRHREMAFLDDRLRTPIGTDRVMVISAIGGAGGIGKTWLALRWAHDHLAHFPDGQLYMDLRGFDPSAEPVPPATAVRAFLDALGVGPQEIPADPHAQAGLYRSLAADRRLLILLDNARDTDQIRPLLPGGAHCTVLVTSRGHFDALRATHGSRGLTLDMFAADEAREVVVRALGRDRVAAEPEAVAGLLRLCAGLPLALAIAAARAASRPDFPLAALVTELQDAGGRLDALSAGDLTTDLRAVMETSHRALDDSAAEVFALLGTAPGPDISLPAAVALTGLPLRRARLVLRALEAAHLVSQHVPGRYRMHDLVRLHAVERGRDLPHASRDAAGARLYRWYRAALLRAVTEVDPLSETRPEESAEPPPGVPAFESADAAWAWLDEEYTHLTALLASAAARGRHSWVVELALALRIPFLHRRRIPDWIGVYTVAARSARHTADANAEAELLANIAVAHCLGGRTEESLPWFRQALAAYRATGNDAGAAGVAGNLGNAYVLLARYADAERTLDEARDAFHRLRALRGEANALNSLGRLATLRGATAEALRRLDRAAELFREAGDGYGLGHCLVNSGAARGDAGEWGPAVRCHEEALALFRRTGDRGGEAEALSKLVVSRVHQDPGTARDVLPEPPLVLHERALALARTAGDLALEAEIHNDTGRTALLLGDPRTAELHHRCALGIAGSHREEELRAHQGLGDALHALGRTEEADQEWARARRVRGLYGLR